PTLLLLPVLLTIAPAAYSQQPVVDSGQAASSEKTNERNQRLADYLSGIKLVGKFTIDGRDVAPKTEEYTISKCEKLEQADMYRMTARIKYGEIDAEVPLDLKILWSGNTPVITMDGFWIPAMGTFDARVMIHKGRYAGTWQHDAVGGHMFGTLQKTEEGESEKSETPEESEASTPDTTPKPQLKTKQ
ncbi:MAG: hypothetical protein GY904_27985, partial [Planctomycetaceae bacterium]|nr:hypothetical protein [Planctomycetaceae bacterium]